MIVLDTNVLSELMRPAPSEAVRRWVAEQPVTTLFTTTVTQAEILFGLESVGRCQAMFSAISSRWRRQERMEMKAI
jgi:predicted nucleic acid-binding protein